MVEEIRGMRPLHVSLYFAILENWITAPWEREKVPAADSTSLPQATTSRVLPQLVPARPGALPRSPMGPTSFTRRPELGSTRTRSRLPGDDQRLPERRTTRMTDPSDDHRGNSIAPLVPGTRSRREDPSEASSHIALGIVRFADSFWL